MSHISGRAGWWKPPSPVLVRASGEQSPGATRQADAVLAGLTPDNLVESRRIQGYEVTVLHAIYHVVEHLAEHTGQIIWATKGLTGEDLGFYAYLEDQDQHTSRQP